MWCVGGVGMGFGKTGLRFGGEGVLCRGRQGVSMTRGGGQFGFKTRGERIYWTMYSGIGVGTFNDTTPDTGPFRSAFVYLEPTAALGFVSKVGAIEVGLKALTTFNVAQWVSSGESRGLVHPTRACVWA